MKTTLLIPVRNEIQSIQVMMPKIDPKWVDEILIIDGQSTDGTPEWLEKHGYRVVRQQTLGIGGAYWEALRVARGDIIIAFSPDGNSVPELIPQLVQKMREGHDMVIVSRYLDGAKSEDDDAVTRFGNWMFTKMARVFGGTVTDSLVMFRAFRRDFPYRLGMRESVLPIFEYELCLYGAKTKARIAEIPGDEPKRIGDIRKMSPLYNGSCLVYAWARALVTRPKPVAPPFEAHASERPYLRRVK